MANDKVKIGVRLDNWKMRDYIRFFQAGNSGDFNEMFRLIAEIVVEWPFAGDPSDPESYLDLTPNEWSAVQQVIGEVVKNAFSGN